MNPTQQMPKEIAGAIMLVMRAVGRLVKDTKNEQGRYNYTSVDSFLAAVSPACSEAGLAILPIEIAAEPGTFEATDRDGKTKIRRQIAFSYNFMLMHESGATWVNERDVRHVTVEAVGAQAYGAAQSYALKQFMRALFLIPTGDADADAHEQHSAEIIRATVKASKAKRETGESQILIDFGNGIETVPAADVADRVIAHMVHLGDAKEAADWWQHQKHGREAYFNEFPRLAHDLKKKVEAFLATASREAAQ